MPPEVCRNARRDIPSLRPYSSAISRISDSTAFWSSVCGIGSNSSFETTCVGSGRFLPLRRSL